MESNKWKLNIKLEACFIFGTHPDFFESCVEHFFKSFSTNSKTKTNLRSFFSTDRLDLDPPSDQFDLCAKNILHFGVFMLHSFFY